MENNIMEIKHHDCHDLASRVTEHNNTLYFEVHVCASAKDEKLTIYEEATRLLKRYDELLEKFGSDRKHILLAHIILRRESDHEEFNRAWGEWMIEGFQPARFATTGLCVPECYNVGIVIIAAKKIE